MPKSRGEGGGGLGVMGTATLIGAGAGGVVGGAVGFGYALKEDIDKFGPTMRGMVIGGLIGAGVGAIGGLIKNKTSGSVIGGADMGQQLLKQIPAAAHQASDALQAGVSAIVSTVQDHPYAAAAAVVVSSAAATYASYSSAKSQNQAPAYQPLADSSV
jgi:hypothetical protein